MVKPYIALTRQISCSGLADSLLSKEARAISPTVCLRLFWSHLSHFSKIRCNGVKLLWRYCVVEPLCAFFIFYLSGYRPQQSKGSVIRVPISLTKERAYKAWSANLAQVNKESVRLQVTSPVDAVVGKYQLYVETKTTIRGSDKPEEYRYQHPEDIIVLFNPWCRGQ